ncbi:MAG: hypothetical protein JSS02_18820 [Planctomycetes bacterium]|nr:hypothetical protein [Planctomycetota bacterium]
MTPKTTAGLHPPRPKMTSDEQMALGVEQQIRDLGCGAFCVMPRVARRVVNNQLEFAAPWGLPPHRKSCVVERDRLLWLVERDELRVAPDEALPTKVILLARPEEQSLAKFSREDLLRYYWRLLYHARIDLELETTVSPQRVPQAELRKRIVALGQVQFDEIQAVLKAEHMLLRPDDLRNVYTEFVAVYHELRAFAPELVSLYFPSLPGHDAVQAVIGRDCDAEALLTATRPGDLTAMAVRTVGKSRVDVGENLLDAGPVRLTSRSPRKYAALTARADRLRARGNNVRAALVRRQAYEKAPLDQMTAAQRELLREVELLVQRLQSALELTDDQARPWLAICERLLPAARHGFWNANARLLYDLQQVCLDHEQEIYKVDLLGWMFSGGKRPLKRPLQSQRVVLMSKHLRSATARISKVEIDDAGRSELHGLLHTAAHAAEQILRRQFEPVVSQTLAESRLVPECVVERVGFQKLTQEMLDGIVERGFLTLGDLRDSISRNQLKSPDLGSFREFVQGDPLLTADRLLARNLDGVYQRGPFYLRWLQSATSLAFGIPRCRAITKYVALPFGLSFLTLMALEELAHLVVSHAPGTAEVATHVASEVAANVPAEAAADLVAEGAAVAVETTADALIPAPTGHPYLIYSHIHMLWLGCVYFALIHFRRFRASVFQVAKLAWKLTRGALWDVPRAVATFPPVAWCLQSFPMLLFRRFVLWPVVVTLLFWKLAPALGFYRPLNDWWGLAILVASLVVLNSRIGRDTQEVTREFIAQSLDQIRAHFVVALFTLIVDTARWLMDGLERLLYAVDEWLRFRSGESPVALGVKAVIGVVWGFVHGVIRFCVILLIEPQLNPVKHFPVVTVSHKLMIGALGIPLKNLLEQFYHPTTAYTIEGLILMSVPGVFGFLAWELKENWKLYAANRSTELKPVRIGHHGESMRRLLTPGFHSGTISRLFAKRRRAARHASRYAHVDPQAKFAEKLHDERERLHRFFDRELLALLLESRTFRDRRLSVGHIDMATNRVQVAILDDRMPLEPLMIQFCEQAGWIVANVVQLGWLGEMTEEDQNVFRTALLGLYKLAAVGLVREQIDQQLIAAPLPALGSFSNSSPGRYAQMNSPTTHPYDIVAEGLVVWPYGHFEAPVRFPLEDDTQSTPRPRSFARAAGLPTLPRSSLVFEDQEISWDDWRAYWQTEQNVAALPFRLLPSVELLKRP